MRLFIVDKVIVERKIVKKVIRQTVDLLFGFRGLFYKRLHNKFLFYSVFYELLQVIRRQHEVNLGKGP